MNAFYEHHKDSIRFGYRCFDRICSTALSSRFSSPRRVVGFFSTYRHLYPVSRDILRGAAEQFQLWVKEQADKWNAPIVEAPRGRRDEFVDPYFRGAKPDQVVVILKAREPARIMIAIGNKKVNRWHLQIAERWIVQYNFYVNDQHWGRMFVRMCPYLPFSARVCLNQHHWLANRMREEGIDFQQCSNAFLRCGAPERLQELADSLTAEICKLRPEVAGPLHAVLHRDRAQTGGLPASVVLRAGRILRQPDLSSPGRARQIGRAAPRRQSHHRPAQQDHRHLRSQGHQAIPGQAANRDRRHEPAQPGHPQSLRQRLHQAIRPRPPHPAHRAGYQQRHRLRCQQGRRASPGTARQDGSRRSSTTTTTSSRTSWRRSSIAGNSESSPNPPSRRPANASPASSSTILDNWP